MLSCCEFCKKVKKVYDWGEYESCDDCDTIISNLRNNCQVCKKEKTVFKYDTGYSCDNCHRILTNNNKTILAMNLEKNSTASPKFPTIIETICNFCKQYKFFNSDKFEHCCSKCDVILSSISEIQRFVCENHKNKTCNCTLCCVCLSYSKYTFYKCKNKLQTT